MKFHPIAARRDVTRLVGAAMFETTSFGSKCTVFWSTYLWQCWDFSAPPHSDSAPGQLCYSLLRPCEHANRNVTVSWLQACGNYQNDTTSFELEDIGDEQVDHIKMLHSDRSVWGVFGTWRVCRANNTVFRKDMDPFSSSFLMFRGVTC